MTGQLSNSYLPTSQHSFVAMLMKSVAYNQLGLPEGIYRPDLLPEPPGLHPDVDEREREPSPGTDADADVSPLTEDELEQEQIRTQALLGETRTKEDSPDLPSPTHPTASLSSTTTSVPAPLSHTHPSLSLMECPEIRAAYVPLCYTEGFPTLEGVPFWIQLTFEGPEAYRCFDMYLRQGTKGARQIYTLMDNNDFPEGITNQDLHEFADLYFWSARAKSYDMFNAAHRRKERERRAISTEDEHYLLANRLMSIATCYLDEQEEELVEMMTPKMLLEFIKTSAQLQRISSGLPANGPSNTQRTVTEGVPQGESTSLEVIMRSIAKESGHTIEAEVIDTSSVNRSKLQEILKDEDAIEMAQELVLKIHNPNPNPNPVQLPNIIPEMETI